MAAERHPFEVDHLFSLLPVAALIIEAQTGHILEVNDQSEALFGLARNEIIGKTPAFLSPELQPDGSRSEELVKEKIANVAQRGGGDLFLVASTCLWETTPLYRSNIQITDSGHRIIHRFRDGNHRTTRTFSRFAQLPTYF